MNDERVTLTIEGEAEEQVRVLYRSNADPQPPPIWEGKLGADGRITVSVPRAYIVVISGSGQAVLRLHESDATQKTVRLTAQ
jgi:hypothetical protein